MTTDFYMFKLIYKLSYFVWLSQWRLRWL